MGKNSKKFLLGLTGDSQSLRTTPQGPSSDLGGLGMEVSTTMSVFPKTGVVLNKVLRLTSHQMVFFKP